jgi:prefoldin subunit 5
MEQINIRDLERKIGYWQHTLSKIDRDMSKIQSKRFDITQKITYLTNLRKQENMLM